MDILPSSYQFIFIYLFFLSNSFPHLSRCSLNPYQSLWNREHTSHTLFFGTHKYKPPLSYTSRSPTPRKGKKGPEEKKDSWILRVSIWGSRKLTPPPLSLLRHFYTRSSRGDDGSGQVTVPLSPSPSHFPLLSLLPFLSPHLSSSPIPLILSLSTFPIYLFFSLINLYHLPPSPFFTSIYLSPLVYPHI